MDELNPYQSPAAETITAVPIDRRPNSWRLLVVLWGACFLLQWLGIESIANTVLWSGLRLSMPLFAHFLVFAHCVLRGLAMAASLILLWRILRAQWQLQPGEWLLLSAGVWHWLMDAFIMLEENGSPPFFPGHENLATGSLYAILMLIGATFLWRADRLWAVALALVAAQSAAYTILSFVFIFQLVDASLDRMLVLMSWVHFSIVFAGVAIIAAFIHDVYRERRRGLLHALALFWLSGEVILYSLQSSAQILSVEFPPLDGSSF